MSQVDTAHAWWSRLRHQGLLLSPVVMLERYPSAPEPAPFAATAKLRDAHTRFVSTAEARKGDAEIEQSAILGLGRCPAGSIPRAPLGAAGPPERHP